MSFSTMHNDYLDPDRHLGGGGAADQEANGTSLDSLRSLAQDYLQCLRVVNESLDEVAHAKTEAEAARCRVVNSMAEQDGDSLIVGQCVLTLDPAMMEIKITSLINPHAPGVA